MKSSRIINKPMCRGTHPSPDGGEHPVRRGGEHPVRRRMSPAAALLLGMAMQALASPASAQDASAKAAPGTARTQSAPSPAELAKLKQNPVSGLRQVGIDASVAPDTPPSGRTAGAYSLQVVWPFALPDPDYRLITYSILPVLQVPDAAGADTTVGLGNTLLNFYLTPAKAGALIWGVGPAVLLPTRSDSALGTNRVGLGPSAVLFHETEKWSAGVVLQNVWSLGGEGGNEVNVFSAQYLANYNLPHGWYLYSNASITADWLADDTQRWTVPVGGGIGKVFSIGKQPVGASVQMFYNAVRPDAAPRWVANFQFSLLFP